MHGSNGLRGRVRSLWLVIGCLGLGSAASPQATGTGTESPTAGASPAPAAAAQRPPRDRVPGRPPRTTVADWLAAGLGKDHPAFKDDGGYLPANVGIAREVSTTDIPARVQKVLFDERRARVARRGLPRPSDAEIQAELSREDASIKQLNQALRRARERLRQLHDANDERGMAALELQILQQHSQQPLEGQR